MGFGVLGTGALHPAMYRMYIRIREPRSTHAVMHDRLTLAVYVYLCMYVRLCF